jgi:sortase A
MWKFRKSVVGNDGAAQDATRDRKRGRNVLKWTQRILLMCGLVLVGVYGAARIESSVASRAALKKFAALEKVSDTSSKSGDETVPSGTEPTLSDSMNAPDVDLPSVDLPRVDFSHWDERRVRAYKQSIGKQSGVPLAVLRIPKIHLEAPLFEGTDDFTLNHAVGRIVGTARPGEPGNIGIAGHRDGFFRGLKDVSVGDAIELKTLQGTDSYVVNEIQIVKPENVEVLQSRPIPSLTLVTCYPFYFFGSAPQRYIVKASLLREKKSEAESSTLSPPSAANNSIRRKRMNTYSKKARLFGKGASAAFVVALLSLGAWAQDSTITTIQHGPSSFDTQVKNAEIVYVEGNDLVLKLENGRVEHLVVPDSDKFTIDGNEVGVRELAPGTKLTQTITTSTTPRYVNTVRTIEGKVWHVNAPTSVILTLPDNTNQVFNVPSHAKFTIDGREKSVFDLKKGMKIKATVVTDDEHTVIEQSKLAFGQAPPVTPREIGVLLFLAPIQPQATLASAEQPADTLPATGTLLPWVGLLGALSLASALGMSLVRKTARQARII